MPNFAGMATCKDEKDYLRKTAELPVSGKRKNNKMMEGQCKERLKS